MRYLPLYLGIALGLSACTNTSQPQPEVKPTSAPTVATEKEAAKPAPSKSPQPRHSKKKTPKAKSYVGVKRLAQLMSRSHYHLFYSRSLESQAYFDQLLANQQQLNCFIKPEQQQKLAKKYRNQLSKELYLGQIKQANTLLDELDAIRIEQLNYLQQHLAQQNASPSPHGRISCSQITDLEKYWHQQQQDALYWLSLADLNAEQSEAYLLELYAQQIQRLSSSPSIEQRYPHIATAFVQAYDAHSSYIPPTPKEEWESSLQSSISGIGSTLAADSHGVRVTNTFTNSPAHHQLYQNDIILAVAEKGLAYQVLFGKGVNAAVELITGPTGSEVLLKVYRPTTQQVFTLSLQRQTIKLTANDPSKLSMLNEHTAKIQLHSLPSGSGLAAAKLLAQLQDQGINNLVLDLRGNGGGALNEIATILGAFDLNKKLYAIKDSKQDILIETATRHNEAYAKYSGKLSVWVDGCTAAGAELIAASLQDQQRAIIVGAPTFGRGTIQSYRRLRRILDIEEDPSLGTITMTTAMLFRPNGDSLQGKGVVPDIALPLPCTLASPQNVLPTEKISPFITPKATLADVISQLKQQYPQQPTLPAQQEAMLKALAETYRQL